jgi:hypothetical protein
MLQTCPNGINKTYLVSFPRSGHHLMVRGLTEAANHKLVYSEGYTPAHNFDTCDHVNLQKSHDFDMDLEIKPDLTYIVLIRAFELAVDSWIKAEQIEDAESFRDSKVEYYDQFMAKWVSPSNENVLVITYPYLTDYKTSAITDAAHHMGFDPDRKALARWEFSERRKFVEPKLVIY